VRKREKDRHTHPQCDYITSSPCSKDCCRYHTSTQKDAALENTNFLTKFQTLSGVQFLWNCSKTWVNAPLKLIKKTSELQR